MNNKQIAIHLRGVAATVPDEHTEERMTVPIDGTFTVTCRASREAVLNVAAKFDRGPVRPFTLPKVPSIKARPYSEGTAVDLWLDGQHRATVDYNNLNNRPTLFCMCGAGASMLRGASKVPGRPGFAVGRPCEEGAPWNVTHLATGLAACRAPTKARAFAVFSQITDEHVAHALRDYPEWVDFQKTTLEGLTE